MQLQAVSLRTLVRSYYSIQKVRVQVSNRIQMLQRDSEISETEAELLHQLLNKRVLKVEKDLASDITDIISEHPLYQSWLSKVMGVGPILSAALIAEIWDIRRFDTISRLWAYAGMHTIDVTPDGKKRWFPSYAEAHMFARRCAELVAKSAEKWGKEIDVDAKTADFLKLCEWNPNAPHIRIAAKRIGGLPANWNQSLKVTCWKLGESFVKAVRKDKKGGYRVLFERFKDEYARKLEGDSNTKGLKGLIHARAKRKTVKVFLAHLWMKWREIEGLPTRKPYILEHGHSTFIEPIVDEP